MTATPALSVRTYDETRTRQPLPSPSSPAWADSATVWRLAVYAERTVDLAAHDSVHPQPMWGCPWCPQSGVCPLCAKPSPECADPDGHRREAAGSESTWLAAA